MRPSHLVAISLFSLTHALPSSSHVSPLPLIIWHGLGDNYDADGITAVGKLANEINPGTFVYPIRLDEDPSSDRSASFFGNVTTQLAQVCVDLAEHPVLSRAPAVNALGFSQGGQFLRGYVERCNSPPVRNLVTFGSQHNGIAEFQACGPTDWVCRGAMGLLHSNTWASFVQSRLVPAQYYRSVNETTGLADDDYLEYSNFLADVNNEREAKNKTYADNIASMNKFVMYVFEDDKTVVPPESGWFAEVNVTSGTVTPLRERTIYKEDWLGLKRLDKKGGLVYETTPGEHMKLDRKVLVEAFEKYFGPSADADATDFDGGAIWDDQDILGAGEL